VSNNVIKTSTLRDAYFFQIKLCVVNAVRRKIIKFTGRS
jgi:hypothetical protein